MHDPKTSTLMPFKALLLAMLAILQSPCAQEHGRSAENAWAEVVNEVAVAGFPQSFVDSLKTLHAVPFPQGLRSVQNAFLAHPERLVFDASWGFISAGFAELAYSPDTGDGVACFTARAATNNFVSAFYRVRDFVRSTVDARGLYPLFFEEHVQEGRYHAQRWAVFDHVNNTAFSHKKGADSIAIPLFALDFLSLIYNIRTMTLVPNDTFTLNCYADGKCWPVFLRAGKRSRITVRTGTFDCIPVMPRIIAEGRVFSKKDNIVIWLTDDDVHMPVLIKAKIKVGSIVAELIHFESGAP